MHRIDSYGATLDNQFTEGAPGPIPVPATVVSADWLNALQEELANILEENEVELVKEDNTQIWETIEAFVVEYVAEHLPPAGVTEAEVRKIALVFG